MLNSNNLGTKLINTEYDRDGIYQVATVDEEKEIIYVKIVNASGIAKVIDIDTEGFGKINDADAQILSSYTKRACNTVGNMTTVPYEKELSPKNDGLLFTAAGYSVNVIRISYGEGTTENIYHLPEMPETNTYFTPAIQTIIDFFSNLINQIKSIFNIA